MQQSQSQIQMPQPQFTLEGGHVIMFHHESEGLPNQTDPNVNDRDRMQDLLSQCKHLSDGYDTAMNEASHDALFQVWKQNHSKVKDLERQVFTTMFKKGWYRLPVADAQAVSDAFTHARKLQSQLPFPSRMPDATGQTAGRQSQSMSQQAGMQSQQLNQVVDQAIREAERGSLPSGYTGSH